VFDVWGRLAETGSGNKSRLVAFESTRLEQRPACCIAFFHCKSFSELCVYVDKIIIFLFYRNLTFVSP